MSSLHSGSIRLNATDGVRQTPGDRHRGTGQFTGLVHDIVGAKLVEDRPQISEHHVCGIPSEEPRED